jgi:hypothetical protein
MRTAEWGFEISKIADILLNYIYSVTTYLQIFENPNPPFSCKNFIFIFISAIILRMPIYSPELVVGYIWQITVVIGLSIL